MAQPGNGNEKAIAEAWARGYSEAFLAEQFGEANVRRAIENAKAKRPMGLDRYWKDQVHEFEIRLERAAEEAASIGAQLKGRDKLAALKAQVTLFRTLYRIRHETGALPKDLSLVGQSFNLEIMVTTAVETLLQNGVSLEVVEEVAQTWRESAPPWAKAPDQLLEGGE